MDAIPKGGGGGEKIIGFGRNIKWISNKKVQEFIFIGDGNLLDEDSIFIATNK